MKRFHLTHYQFFDRDLAGLEGLKIFAFSDLHFSHQVSSNKLKELVQFAKNLSPDYIFFTGDLIDSDNMIELPSEEQRLLGFLTQLSNICPLLISLGNHDFYHNPDSKKHRRFRSPKWEVSKNHSLQQKISSLKNVHLLDNASFEDQRIYVAGLTQSPDYYNFIEDGPDRTTLFHPTFEKCEVFLETLKSLDQKLIKNLPKNKLKFALIHSPVCLSGQLISQELSEFDYFISGHMHNGIVPPILDELLPGTRGFVSPSRNILLPGVRNTIKNSHDKSIVLGAATTFHECSGPAHHLNCLFPVYTALIEFSSDSTLKAKPKVKKSYLKH